MAFFKLFFLLSSLFATITSDDGWYPVEKAETAQSEENWEQQDPSIWPTFVKKIESDTLTIQFPGNPDYRYLSHTEMAIFATHGGESSELYILDPFPSSILKQRVKEI